MCSAVVSAEINGTDEKCHSFIAGVLLDPTQGCKPTMEMSRLGFRFKLLICTETVGRVRSVFYCCELGMSMLCHVVIYNGVAK